MELNKIYQGDSLKMLKNINDKFFDVTILDPPHDNWSKIIKHIKEIERITKNHIIIFTQIHQEIIRQKINKLLPKRCDFVWHYKDGRWVSNNLPRKTCQIITWYQINKESYVNMFVGDKNYDNKPIKKGKCSIGKDKYDGERVYVPNERKMLNDVIEIPRNVNQELGLWSKPDKLMEIIIRAFSEDNDIIFDPFFGSGTTGGVAQRLGRKWIGIELNPEYIKIADKRFAQQDLFSP